MRKILNKKINYKAMIMLAPALFLFAAAAYCQGFDHPVPELIDVSFSGSGNFTIKSDLDGSAQNAPHYIQSPNTQKPVGYVRNTYPRVSAKFSYSCPKNVQSVSIRGDVGGVQGVYPAVSVPATQSLTYPATNSNTLLPNTAFYYQNYQIDWKASVDGGTTWQPAGSSKNPLYVVLANPLAEDAGSGYLWYQTLVHIGCKEGSGTNTAEALFNKAWLYIKTRNVTRVADGAKLSYYKRWFTPNITTGSLINNTDGQCLAWTRFLIDILRVQGYEDPNHTARVVVKPTESEGFIVQTWTFNPNGGSSGDPNFPYLNKFGAQPHYGEYGPYYWNDPEVTDDNPAPGQGENQHPVSDFGIHQFAHLFSGYYDPSYGVTYQALPGSGFPDLEPGISGYYNAKKWPANNPPKAYVFRTNPPGIQTTAEFLMY